METTVEVNAVPLHTVIPPLSGVRASVHRERIYQSCNAADDVCVCVYTHVEIYVCLYACFSSFNFIYRSSQREGTEKKKGTNLTVYLIMYNTTDALSIDTGHYRFVT